MRRIWSKRPDHRKALKTAFRHDHSRRYLIECYQKKQISRSQSSSLEGTWLTWRKHKARFCAPVKAWLEVWHQTRTRRRLKTDKSGEVAQRMGAYWLDHDYSAKIWEITAAVITKAEIARSVQRWHVDGSKHETSVTYATYLVTGRTYASRNQKEMKLVSQEYSNITFTRAIDMNA